MADKISFEQKLSRLEEIVKLIENEQTPLDEVLELYAEATRLATECKQTLEEAELTLKEMKAEDDDRI